MHDSVKASIIASFAALALGTSFAASVGPAKTAPIPFFHHPHGVGPAIGFDPDVAALASAVAGGGCLQSRPTEISSRTNLGHHYFGACD